MRVTGTDAYSTILSTGLSLYVGAGAATGTAAIEVGRGRSGDGISFVDLIGDATYTDYGLRLIRSSGANGGASLINRGTGAFIFQAGEGADWEFSNTLKVDTIAEKSTGVGVAVDGVLIKDGGATFTSKLLPSSPVDSSLTLSTIADINFPRGVLNIFLSMGGTVQQVRVEKFINGEWVIVVAVNNSGNSNVIPSIFSSGTDLRFKKTNESGSTTAFYTFQ